MTIPSSLRALWDTLKEDLSAHSNDPTRPGFLAVATQRFGAYVHQLPRSVARKPLVLTYRVAYVGCRNLLGIELPYSVSLGRRVVIEHQGGIVIHGRSVIGDDCIIRQGCTLGNRYMDRPDEAPVLGDRVNVGAGAKILGKVQIGHDTAIGANSVVIKDVQDGFTVVGIPARVVADLCPPTAVKLGDLKLS